MRPRGLELQQGELGDLVEQEMSATSAAVESAAARIEVISQCFFYHKDRCLIKHEALQSTCLMFFPFALCNRKCSISPGQLTQESKWKSMKGQTDQTTCVMHAMHIMFS